jgi:predicted nucleic acid-binding protein
MIVAADTNVFVYAADDRDPAKQAVAREVFQALVAGSQPISLQVVGEVQNVLRRRLGMPTPVASQQARNLFAAFPSFGYDGACVDLALAHASAGRLGYWDGLLLAACSRAGVEALLSEDMQDGAVFAGVRVINPFASGGLSEAARAALAA